MQSTLLQGRWKHSYVILYGINWVWFMIQVHKLQTVLRVYWMSFSIFLMIWLSFVDRCTQSNAFHRFLFWLMWCYTLHYIYTSNYVRIYSTNCYQSGNPAFGDALFIYMLIEILGKIFFVYHDWKKIRFVIPIDRAWSQLLHRTKEECQNVCQQSTDWKSDDEEELSYLIYQFRSSITHSICNPIHQCMIATSIIISSHQKS